MVTKLASSLIFFFIAGVTSHVSFLPIGFPRPTARTFTVATQITPITDITSTSTLPLSGRYPSITVATIIVRILHAILIFQHLHHPPFSPPPMAFASRRALGALLTVSFATAPAVAASDRALPADPVPSLLKRAAALSDHPPTPSSTPAPLSAADAAHARAVLDRYYALSAEATASNKSSPPSPTSPPTAHKPAHSRTPPSLAFRNVKPPPSGNVVRFRNVIVGGGTAAWAALDALAETNPELAANTLVLAEESYPPYNRTPLSKEAWTQSDVTAVTHYAYAHVQTSAPVALMRGARAVALDLDKKLISLVGGGFIQFDKVLLATGGQPRPSTVVCPAFSNEHIAENVSSFRTLDDFSTLRERASRPGASVVIVGGGFLAAELAVALSGVCKQVSLVVADAGVLYRVLPRYMCEVIARKIGEAGVNVVTSAVVTDARKGDSGKVELTLEGSEHTKTVTGGEVVTAIGIEPAVELAKDAGLELDERNGGIRVNDFMMAEPDVFVAGDVASFHDRALGRRRVEHWDHAVVTGRIAGRNMGGQRERYGLQSMFWADLSNVDVDVTAVGLVDSGLDTVGVWNTALPSRLETPSANELLTGVVYYLKKGEIVGVVLWNARKGVGALRRARALVDAKTNVTGLSEQVLGDLVNLDDGSFRMCVKTKGSPKAH